MYRAIVVNNKGIVGEANSVPLTFPTLWIGLLFGWLLLCLGQLLLQL